MSLDPFDARRSFLESIQSNYSQRSNRIYYTTSDTQTMATIETAKLNHLHKKIIERYLESPTSNDEETLALLDYSISQIAVHYHALGFQEHPVFVRDRWVSEVAARRTDESYWGWTAIQVSSKANYRFTGGRIFEVGPTDEFTNESMPAAGGGTFSHQGIAAGVSPTSPFLNHPAPPPPPRPRSLAEEFAQVFETSATATAPTRVEL